MGDLYRKRGDTYSVKLTITNTAGEVQDISGKTFVLTVASTENPDDATTEMFQLVGTITDAPVGKLEFPMSLSQANNVGEFFFDVEMTTTATDERRTVLKGAFMMEQDITKSDVEFTLDLSGGVGTDVVADGTELFRYSWQSATKNFRIHYALLDSDPAIELAVADDFTTGLSASVIGDSMPVMFFHRGERWEVSAVIKLNNAAVGLGFAEAGHYDPSGSALSTAFASFSTEHGHWTTCLSYTPDLDINQGYSAVAPGTDLTNIKFEIDWRVEGASKIKYWLVGDSEPDWMEMAAVPHAPQVAFFNLAFSPYGADFYARISNITFRRLA